MTEPASPEKLAGHSSRAPSTGNAGCGAVFGLIFVVVGVGLILIAVGVGGLDIGSPARLPTFGISGLAMILLGFHLIVGPILRAIGRSGKRKPRHVVNEPWWTDHPWATRELAAEQKTGFGTFYGSLIFAAILAPFNFYAFAESGMSGCWTVGMLFLDALAAAGLLSGLYQIFRWLKYGSTRLRVGTFPFLLGKRFDAVMMARRRLDKLRTLTVTLRCVEEREVQEKNKTRECFVLWTQTRTFDSLKRVMRQGRDLPIMFELPPDATLGTILAQPYPRYWELEIKGDAPGIDFRASFLVPVYPDPKVS